MSTDHFQLFVNQIVVGDVVKCKSIVIRNMESKRFGDLIYDAWGLDPKFNYRANGHLVTVNKKVMMLFDFSDAEHWVTKKDGN